MKSIDQSPAHGPDAASNVERMDSQLNRLHAVEAVLASIEDLTAEASPDLPMQATDRIFSLAGLARSEVQSIRSALASIQK